LCTLSLGAIFVGELGTPDEVVETLALAPLLAANWALSGPFAGAITALAVVLFGAAAIADKPGRPSIILVGSVSIVAAILVRLYATSISRLLSRHRHVRPSIPLQATPRTLDGIDQVSHGLGSLTRRELEIARLAAQGYTAAEISWRLHISNRTVESHLANTYAKLRITSRPELIRMSSRLGNA
jgi:DNA-binding CsgD family transcriptional regulator